MMQRKQIFLFLFLYAFLRIFSYFFSPETPLYAANPLNAIVSTIILAAAAYLLWKKDERGWYIVALEMILGGSGGYLAVGELALRTCLLAASLAIFFFQKISDKNFSIKNYFKENKKNVYLLFCIVAIGIISAIHGLFAGHQMDLIIADTIPYLFFLYYFPLQELLRSERFKQLALNILAAAVIGNFVFILFTFVGFSSHLFLLQDAYYHWYRDVALGKITELPFNFYRLVLNEQLLLVPLLLFFLSKAISKSPLARGLKGDVGSFEPTPPHPPAGRDLMLVSLLLAILSVNLTRIYLVALIVGLLLLFTRTNWKRWLFASTATIMLFFVFFTGLHLAVSRGQSLGWELFGLRLQSIVSPTLEESSLSRLLLLPKIIEKIKTHPVLGNGLGDTVTVYSPIIKQEITTPQFDWGYLEIFDELGVVGLIAWLSLISYLFWKLHKNRALMASLVALAVINITSPALFHVLGVVWITALLSLI